MERQRAHHRSRWVIGLAVIGALVLLVRNRTEPEQFARVVEHARPAWLLLAVVLQLATYPCTALVWTYVVRRAGGRAPPIGKLLRLSVAELFTDQTIPSGGLSGTFLVVSSLEKRGVPPRAAVGAVVASLAGFYLAQIAAVIAAFVVLLVSGRFGGWEVTASTIAIIGALAIPIPLVLALVGALNKLPRRLRRIHAISELRERVNDAPKDLVFSPSVLAVSTALRFAVIVLDGATLAIALVALGSPMSLVQVIAAFALAYVVGSVTFLPGGLGTFEVASTTLLASIGVPFAAAGAATLLMRGLSFWLPMIPGGWFARREMTRKDGV